MRDFEEYRKLAGGDRFSAIKNQLRENTVPTRQLQAVIDAVQAIHNQLTGAGPQMGDAKLPISGLLIVGESGAGKSYSLGYAVDTLPHLMISEGHARPPKAVKLEAPGYGTVSTLARDIQSTCDGVTPREPKDSHAAGKAIAAVTRHDLTLLAVDDVTRLLTAEHYGSRQLAIQSHLFFAMVIGMLNRQVPVALTGLPFVTDLFLIKGKDEPDLKVRREAQRRLNIVQIPPASVKSDADLMLSTIAGYCGIVDIESLISTDDMLIQRLFHAAYNQIGSALELAQKAVAMARVRKNSKLTRTNFAIVYKLETDVIDEANPFLVSDWERIDVGRLLPKTGAAARFQELSR